MKKIIEEVSNYIDDKRNEMLSVWQQFVNIETGSNNKEGIDKLANIIKEILQNESFDISIKEVESGGNSIFAVKKGNGLKKPICIMGHMDTVFPTGTLAKRPFTIKDEKVFGPGVLDMKGGLVIALYAVKALNHLGYNDREIRIMFSGDEEVGHKFSKTHNEIMEFVKGSKYCFNTETGSLDNGIVIGRKGSIVFEIETFGKAVHSGIEHENGISAILEIANKVIDIEKLTDYDEGITFNVGVIKGGLKSNIRPDHAMIEVDCRFTKLEQKEKIIQSIKEIVEMNYVKAATSKLEYNLNFFPMEETEGSRRLLKKIIQISNMLGLEKPYGKYTGGSSDSSNAIRAGVPTLCAFGVKGKGNHSPEEYAVLESLYERTKLLVVAMME